MSDIKSRIKELRLNLNLTQEEFGNKIGLSKSGISNIENGSRGIRERHIKLISSTFNVSEEWLKTGRNTIEKLVDNVRCFEIFISYLKSIGYKITVEKVGDPSAGHWEDAEDESGNIEEIWITDNETATIIVSKGDITIGYSEEGFQQLKNNIEKTIEFELWKSISK